MRPDAPHTLPLAGRDPFPRARARFLGHVARLLLDGPPGRAPSPAGARLRGAVEPLLASGAGEVLGALALPPVSTPVLAAAAFPDLPDAAAVAGPRLLLELARRRLLGPAGVFWESPFTRLLSPPLGADVRLDGPPRGAWFTDGAVEVRLAAGTRWTWDLDDPRPRSPAGGVVRTSAFRPLAAGGWLALADDNPLASVEAHPEKAGSALDLGDAPPERWAREVDAARGLVARVLPDLAREHAGLLAQVVPVGTHAERSSSASYREAVGTVYVSLHPRPATMAEALVHEVQHNKLNLLSHLDPLLEGGGGDLYRSPVRPDPRPLWGVLLAAHAFVAVAELYLALVASGGPPGDDPETVARLGAVQRANDEALEVLRDAARPTALGSLVLAGIEALHHDQRARAG